MSYRIEQDFEYKGNDWWEWSVWVEASDTQLDQIENVEYVLDPTFAKPVREIRDRATKFRLETSGWGVFTIYANAYLKDGKVVNLEHELILKYRNGKRTYK